MALNVVFDGLVFDGNGSVCDGTVSYQAYFYQVNSGSSSSTWNNVRTVESGLSAGYFNCNLGDADFLSQTGVVSSGDVVIIVFWDPTSADRLDACSSLNEWSVFRIVLDGSSTYTNDTQVRSNTCPNLNWSLAATGLVDANVTATNTSTDTHQWDFNGNTMYQRDSWYTTLMTINNVDNTDFDWGDSSQDTDLVGASNGTHSWSSSGDYTVEIVIEDDCGCTVTGTDTIRIYNNPPVPDITMTPTSPDPNEVVTFQYTGTDVDNTITNIAWTIEDNGTYGNTDTISGTNARDDVITHASGIGTDWYGQSGNVGAFTNPGDHQVSVVITWWDGFSNQTINYDETYNQAKFSGPAVNFTQDPTEAIVGTSVEFTNISSDTSRVGLGLPNHIEYNWQWTDGTTIENETDQPFSYKLTKTPVTTTCNVELCAQWSDGWDTQETCIDKDVPFDTNVTVSAIDCYYGLNITGTSDDGSVTGYGWTVYSGSSALGPWGEEWNSPVDMGQQEKYIAFTVEGWYRVVGTVYGTGSPTTGYEILEIDEVCATVSGTEECDIVIPRPPMMRGSYAGPCSLPPTRTGRVPLPINCR